jgi:DNA-binding MarR family transcriptional regulator
MGAVAATAELSHELVRHARVLHALRVRLSASTPGGLEWGAFTLLARLVKDGPRRQGELAQCAMLDPSTVSRHVAQLVRSGLVVRAPDPSDGRAVRLAPTPKGEETYRAVAQRRDDTISRVLAGWPAEDVDTLVRLLARLNDDFEAYGPPTSKEI